MHTGSLKARNIGKSFAGVRVLTRIDLEIKAGTIYGLFGHNGAGKSTLLKIMAGAQRPDHGELLLGDEVLQLTSPRQALLKGIGCVYQELRLVPNLTVAENLFLGREITRHGIRSADEMNAQSQRLLAGYGLDIAATKRVSQLAHPEKQLLEVIANLESQVRYLFLDEPTTALDGQQATTLLAHVRRIAKARQIGIILVSHKLDEVLGVCDEATVLSAGRVIYHACAETINKQAIIDSVVGEVADHAAPAARNTRKKPGETFLRVNRLRGPRLKQVSLEARRGDIIGLYGLMGSGRTRFLRSLYGMEPIYSGQIAINGSSYLPTTPAHAIHSGIAFLSEERKSDGFIPHMSALRNVTLPTLQHYRQYGFLRLAKMHAKAREQLAAINTLGQLERPIQLLSGGNQQKVLLGRIIEQNADLVLLDEPSKGVDIGAKADIYSIITQLAEEGRCIVVVSSEEEELLELCDKIAIFRHGECTGEALPVAQWTLASLRQAAWSTASIAA